MVLPLPPRAEQNRIVAKIEELLPLIDRYEQAWSRLEDLNKRFPTDLQKSILQLAIQGKLVPQRPEEGTGEDLYNQIQAEKRALIAAGKLKKEKPLPEITEDEKPFDIPEGWMWVRIGNIASVLGGKRIPAGRKLTQENTGHVYIRISDMKNDTVVASELMFVPEDIYPSISKYIINKEDVYITVAGTIGRVGKIPPSVDGANLTENADRLVFREIDQDWLIQCLKSTVVQSQILDATTKVGQPKLAIKRIQEMLIPLPPVAEQKRIVARLNELLPLCEKLKR
jgi:type I restriction enzyme S subunit